MDNHAVARNEIEAAKASLSNRLEKEKDIAAAERYITTNRPTAQRDCARQCAKWHASAQT